MGQCVYVTPWWCGGWFCWALVLKLLFLPHLSLSFHLLCLPTPAHTFACPTTLPTPSFASTSAIHRCIIHGMLSPVSSEKGTWAGIIQTSPLTLHCFETCACAFVSHLWTEKEHAPGTWTLEMVAYWSKPVPSAGGWGVNALLPIGSFAPSLPRHAPVPVLHCLLSLLLFCTFPCASPASPGHSIFSFPPVGFFPSSSPSLRKTFWKRWRTG